MYKSLKHYVKHHAFFKMQNNKQMMHLLDDSHRPPIVFSSDRSSYSDSVILDKIQLFEISSISANVFSFSFWEFIADW